MTCKEALSLIQRRLDNDLTAAEEECLRQHLEACPHCLKTAEQLNHLHQELSSLPKVNPPYSLVDRVLEMVEDGPMGQSGQEPDAKEHNRKRIKKRFWLPGAALVAGLFLALILVNNRDLAPQENSLSAPLPELSVERIQPESASENDGLMSGARVAPEVEDAVLFSAPDEDASHAERFGELDKRVEREQPGIQEFSPAMDAEVKDGLAEADDKLPFSLAEFTVDEEKKYVSPDGLYTAYLGLHDEEIFIDKEGEAYYISKHSWKAPWEVKEITWLDHQHLYYVLYHPELDEYQFWLIDVEERTEEQLEEAWKHHLNKDRGNHHGSQSGLE